jgi:predicted O-linked N-acetylglucosamine transferase (SPINDLY family)
MSNEPASDALAQAFSLLRAGRLDAAAAAVRDLLAREPREPRAHALDARMRALQGDLAGAGSAIERALALDPRCAPALVERAGLARASGDAAGAAAALQELVAIVPRQPAFWFDLGVLRAELGAPDAASEAFARVLALAPDHADAWFRRAAIDAAAGRHAAAVEGWRRCLALRPGWTPALHNLGESLLALGRNGDALAAWQEAARATPDDARAWDGVARAAKAARDLPTLLAARERCAERDGGPVGWSLLGKECVGAGDLPGARRAFARSAAADPGYLAARWALFQYPADAVRGDEAAEAAFRTQWLDGLAAFEREPLEQRRVDELVACVTLATEFEVHYLGEAMVDAQRRYGALLERMMALAFADRPLPVAHARTDGRRRIGFCSSMMRTHTVTKLFAALTGALDRARWEVCCFHPADLENAGTEAWRRHADVFVGGEHDLGWWVDTLRAHRLDALVFPDIGMHPFVQGLASMRFAPLQAMLWGHPQTSGRSTIDWFLTADAMEAADGARHYTERLHRLPGLGTAYAPPTLQPVPPPEFAARDADALHCFVAQQAVKLRPAHDGVFARIAAALPQARFHFVPSPSATVRAALQARIAARFAAAGLDFERHRGMFRFVSEAEFLAIGAGCDLNLDSIGWSGGNTTLEILWHGTPTVTLPGELMRSRHTMAMLRVLELPQLIAHDEADYVRIVVELGRSRDLRADLRGTILERRHRLYDDPRVGPAFAAFIEESTGD